MSVSRPYAPVLSVAGHFLSMQPTEDVTLPIEKLWYRGDQYKLIVDEATKYFISLQDIMKQFTTAPDPDVLKILDIVEKALK